MNSILASSTWVYRSFHNDATLVGDDPAKALALIFGEGVFSLTLDGAIVTGQFVMSSDYVLDVSGQFTEAGTAPALALVGKGRPGTPTAGWQYDYQAFLSPRWAAAVNQVAAFTGTVIRALPHNGQPAGVTASFIMLAGKPNTSG
jgi:voltage-gated potassium channel Kch